MARSRKCFHEYILPSLKTTGPEYVEVLTIHVRDEGQERECSREHLWRLTGVSIGSTGQGDVQETDVLKHGFLCQLSSQGTEAQRKNVILQGGVSERSVPKQPACALTVACLRSPKMERLVQMF